MAATLVSGAGLAGDQALFGRTVLPPGAFQQRGG
ncbi:hypothetical protein PSYPI_49587, partial [Pseudomonas syringae pv. pisi str. 1704B]